jgi:ABC-type hemin transport system substrate-binding protein
MSVNADTFAHALLSLAGGSNVFAARPERYPEITIDDLVRAAPRLVLLCTEPFPFQSRHVAELVELTAYDPARIRVADGEYLSWHGSRTPDGIDYAERLIEEARALRV